MKWVTAAMLVGYINDGYKVELKNESKQSTAEFFFVDGVYKHIIDGETKVYKNEEAMKNGLELCLHTGYKIQPLGIKEFAYKK